MQYNIHEYYTQLSISHHSNLMNKNMNTNTSTTNVASSFSSVYLGRNSFSLDMLFFVVEIRMVELLLACLVFIAIHSIRQKKYQGLPNWPLVGMLPSLIIGVRHDIYEWISEVICRMNGTFVFRGPWFTSLNCVVTADPRNLEYLLKTRFSNFPKGEYFRNSVRDLLGDGIFSADDEIWQRQRKTASLEFHSAKFRQLTTESLLQLVHERLLPVLEDSIKKGAPVDIQDILLRLTFDNVCMIAFGVDPGCLSLGLPNIPFAQAFEAATETTIARFVTPTFVWKTMRFLNLGTEGALRQSIKGVDQFAQEVIRTRKKELSLETDDIKQRSDLLTVFMRQKDERGQPLPDKFLRDVCVNFILAGRDTSSVALCWFFWLLNKHPEVEEKIMAEISQLLNKRQNSTSQDYEEDLIFKPEEVKKMEYLHAALSESLRLYPSVPMDHKEVLEDDVFPDGTILKKGTKVIYAIYTMGRMEAIWGKDCREYKPERWIRDGRYMSESAYKFTAFNGGPRLCLGKDFAYYQMKFVAASILCRYHVTVTKDHNVAPKMALTMYLKHGLKVQLSRREKPEIRNT